MTKAETLALFYATQNKLKALEDRSDRSEGELSSHAEQFEVLVEMFEHYLETKSEDNDE